MVDNPQALTTGSGDETTIPPNPPVPSPSPSPSNDGSGSTPAGPSAATPSPTVTLQPAPNIVHPKRGGLAGVVDEMLDDLAGTKGKPRVETGSDGSQYLRVPTLSRKEQWFKILGEAVHGAAAGAAAKPGPGQTGRALEAGVQAGENAEDREANREHELQQSVRQNNQDVRQAKVDQFNLQKLKMDNAAQEFELNRLKVKATHEDIEFAQKQQDRMDGLVNDGKAFDLGTYSDEANLAEVRKVHPEFWKSFHNGDISGVPVIDSDGNRKGIHVYLTTTGVGNEPKDGQKFYIYKPPMKPGEKPTLEEQTATVPMTDRQVEAADLAAHTQYQKWQQDQTAEELKKAEIEEKKSEKTKNIAEAGKFNAESALASGGNPSGKKPDGTWDQNSLPVAMVEGDMDPSQLSKWGRQVYNQTLEAANQYSMERYGKRFDVAKAATDFKYANQKTTQDTLRLLRSLTGDNNNEGGTLQQLQQQYDVLNKMHITSIPKINDLQNWIDKNKGNDAVTNFGGTLLGVSDEIGKILGGGIATDKSRAEAREILDDAFSGKQARGVIGSIRGTLANRQNAIVEDNRYLMKSFGQMLPPAKPVIRDGTVIGYTRGQKDANGKILMTPVPSAP